MTTQYMWGDKQQYGPFGAGEDGYPCSGEVVRHYRVLKGYSARKFAELYGLALGESTKTRIWVLTMERTNNVPTDITRRRAMADLLDIPYVLLGISETLAKTPIIIDVPVPKQVVATPRVTKRETMISGLLTEHEQSLTAYFNGYYRRHGQAALTSVTKATKDIALWLPHSREHIKQRGLTLISRYHQFGRAVACEQQRYDLATRHAEQAIAYAELAHEIKPNTDLMAVVAYRRGLTSFLQYETAPITQESDYRDADSCGTLALMHAAHATPVVKGVVSLEFGLIQAYTATSERDKSAVRERFEDAYNALSAYREDDDLYALKYNASWYQIIYAQALIAIGEYAEALGELDVAEEQTPITFPRRFAFIDALRATAYLNIGEFEQAVSSARDALIESKAVKSDLNVARVAQVYRQLREKYKRSGDLTELGRELAKTHPQLV